MFAAIVDHSCLQWIQNQNQSGKTCVLYHNNRFSIGLAILGFCVRLCSAAFAALTLYFIRRANTAAHAASAETGVQEAIADKTADADSRSENMSDMNVKSKDTFTYLNKAYINDDGDEFVFSAVQHDNKEKNKSDEFDKTSSQI